MNQKDIKYWFTPMSFIDDPYYFIGKAFRIRKQRRTFERNQDRVHEEVQRLRLQKSIPNLQPSKTIELEKEIEYLTNKRDKKFAEVFRKQLSPDDWASRKAYKIDRGVSLLGKLLKGSLRLSGQLIKIAAEIKKS
jgi:hypothetical protein